LREFSIHDRRIFEFNWIRRLVKKLNPDILHSHALWYPGYYGVFLNVRNFVVTVMNGDVLYHHGRDAGFAHHLMVMYAVRKAKLITGVSQTLIDAAIRHGARKDKTRVVRRGVDFSLFNSSENRNEIRKKLSLSAKYIVLSPRYLAPVGNVETLIRTVPLIVQKIQDIEFVFIFPNETQLSYLQDLARRLQIEHYLKFVGRVLHEDVALYHQAADVMVSIPLADSGPIAMQEAMACGAIPIMSDLPCVREWIEHDWNGILVPAKNFQRLANEIIELLENNEKRSLFAERNLKLIQEKGDQEYWMKRMEELYYSLLNKKGR